MKITVLNGSPKSSEFSVTMKYIQWLIKKFPQHEIHILDIGSQIRSIESNEGHFNQMINQIRDSQGIIWAFPLYYCLVPSQYKRFIELIFERNAQEAFNSKYSCAIASSIHFFDHTALNYIHAINDDLKMPFTGSFSASMHDLFFPHQRTQLELFAEKFFLSIQNQYEYPPIYSPIQIKKLQYQPEPPLQKQSIGSKKAVIICDELKPESNLAKMVFRLQESFHQPVKVIDLKTLKINGGCIGCLHCGFDNICSYEGKDDYIDFFNDVIKTSDMIFFAGEIKDRYLSSRWKQFFDRSFFNTHSYIYAKKQIGFIVSGPLNQIPNISELFKGFFEVQGSNFMGFISDDCENSKILDQRIHSFAAEASFNSLHQFLSPISFLGTGGRKIFRDDIWGSLRFVFTADHKFYKKNKLYDFPQKNYRARIINFVFAILTKIPGFKKEFQKRIKNEMVKPYLKILNKIQ